MKVLGDMRFAVAAGIAASLLDAMSSARGQHWGDVLALAYFAAYAYYCIKNFLVCGEVHCLITGPGFLAAAVLMALRISGIWDRGNGPPWSVFVGALILGYGVQCLYAARSGSIYLKRP